MVLYGCGDDSPRPAANTIVLTEYELVPKSLSVDANATLTVRNEGKIAHNIVIERRGNPLDKVEKLIGTDTFLGGRQASLKIELPPGKYTMVCSVPGHRQLGMYGTVTVR